MKASQWMRQGTCKASIFYDGKWCFYLFISAFVYTLFIGMLSRHLPGFSSMTHFLGECRTNAETRYCQTTGEKINWSFSFSVHWRIKLKLNLPSTKQPLTRRAYCVRRISRPNWYTALSLSPSTLSMLRCWLHFCPTFRVFAFLSCHHKSECIFGDRNTVTMSF